MPCSGQKALLAMMRCHAMICDVKCDNALPFLPTNQPVRFNLQLRLQDTTLPALRRLLLLLPNHPLHKLDARPGDHLVLGGRPHAAPHGAKDLAPRGPDGHAAAADDAEAAAVGPVDAVVRGRRERRRRRGSSEVGGRDRRAVKEGIVGGEMAAEVSELGAGHHAGEVEGVGCAVCY